MPTVTLDFLQQAVLILPWECGVVYSNQAGGHSCQHPELEGILVPVSNDPPLDHSEPSTVEQLRALFPGGWGGIDPALADRIDAVLASSAFTSFVRVDRARLRESMEAWLWVVVDFEAPFSPAPGLAAARFAILTWPNSD